jgi:SAM-dependent methyltransferase
MAQTIERREGRYLFGLDPAGYDTSRPAYPTWIFERLQALGALRAGAAVLEIGAGSGRATRQLLAFGANPLIAIEPDTRFGPLLRSVAAEFGATTEVLHDPFEDVVLPEGRFDLVTAATAFHWIEPHAGLAKAHRLLQSGGTIALFWNVLQDLERRDAFHEATEPLLAPLAMSPSGPPNALPFPLDRAARESELRTHGFDAIDYRESKSIFPIDSNGVRALYASFSHIQRIDAGERIKILDALAHIADAQFGGNVERYVTSCLYTARRP